MPSERGRNTANYQRMAKAFKRQCELANKRCHICGQEIDYRAPQRSGGGFSVDHFHPVSTHPELSEDYSNFRASHLDCNVHRGNRPPPLGLGTPSQDW